MATYRDTTEYTAEAIAFEKEFEAQYGSYNEYPVIYPKGMLISTRLVQVDGSLVLQHCYAGHETYCHIYGDHGQKYVFKSVDVHGPIREYDYNNDPCPF